MANMIVPVAAGIGINLVSRLLNPGQRNTVNRQEAQRLDDLGAPESSYGYYIRDLMGVCRVDGCSLIWAKDLREEITVTSTTDTTRSGRGKGRGGNATSTTETETANYYMTAAFLIGGPINQLRKVFANGVQIYNVDDNNPFTEAWAEHTEVYVGSLTQDPSPTIESNEEDAVPALRGYSYIVFDDYPIELYRGSSFPKIDVEVYGLYTETSPERLNFTDAIAYPFQKLGIWDRVSLEAQPTVVMYGAVFENSGENYGTYFQDLAMIHGLDYYESAGELRIINRQSSGSMISIPMSSLCARRYGEEVSAPYKKIKIDPITIPAEVRVEFLSRNKDCSRNNVNYRDPASDHDKAEKISTRIVTNESDMMRTASRLLYQAKTESHSIEDLYFLPSWAGLKPGDEVGVLEEGVNKVYRVMEVAIAEDYRVVVKGVATFRSFIYTQPEEGPGVATPPFSPGDIPDIPFEPEFPGVSTPTVGTANVIPLDIPLISDAHPDGTLYLAVEDTGNWVGGGLYVSLDGGASYQRFGSQNQASVLGEIGSAIPSIGLGDPLIDESTVIRVEEVVGGLLSSVTQAKFDANQGLLFLAGNEIIMARDAVIVEEGVYDLSYLRRGVRGTEWASGDHSVGERFVLLSGPLSKITLSPADLDKELRFKAVGVYGSEPSVTTEASITFAGVNYKPYSPFDVGGFVDQGGNKTIQWIRRDRHDGFRFEEFFRSPMSESEELYEIDILSGSTIVATYSANEPSFYYSAAQQEADFGSVPASFNVAIYQMSGVVGRGYPLVRLFDPNLVPLIPVVEGFSPTQGEIGVAISIFGFGFTGAIGAAIAGEPIDDFAVVDDNTITGTVAEDTVTGKVGVTNAVGTGFSITDFVVVDAITVDWGQIGGEIRDQLDLQDRFNRIRRYTTITANATVPSVGGTVDVTLTDPDGFAPSVPVCLFRTSTVGSGSGYAQMLCIGRTGNTLTLERDATGLVTQTSFLAGDIIAPIIDREVNIYGGLSVINQITNKLKNVESILTTKILTLSAEYFQFLTPTASSVIVRLPAVTGSDYFEGEIINAGDGTNELVIQESDATPIITLSSAEVIRSIYYYWDGSIWRIFERNVYG